VTPEGERLHRHLDAAISTLKDNLDGPKMRGIQRLANASNTLMKQADAIADAAAAKLETAYGKHIEVAGKYAAHADVVAKKADEALDQLNQISNLDDPTQA